jgi:hypothetical protein
MRKPDHNPAMADKSDKEIAADLRMVVAQEWQLERELAARGYEVGPVMRFDDGTVGLEINHVQRRAL